MTQTFTSDIINLNVGGTKFSTSRQTLCSIPDSFFSALLSGRIPSCRDEHGYVFIDRDPKYFSIILNFLRTKELNISGIEDISMLRNEAEFYAITPLVKRLILCEDLDRSLCGDVLFTGIVPAPLIITKNFNSNLNKTTNNNEQSVNLTSSNLSTNLNQSSVLQTTNLKPGNVLRLYNSKPPINLESSLSSNTNSSTSQHSRNPSTDFLNSNLTSNRLISHSRKSSNEISNFGYTNYSSMVGGASALASGQISANTISSGGGGGCGGGGGGCSVTTSGSSSSIKCHSRNQSLDLKQFKTDLGILLTDCSFNTQFNSNNINNNNNSNFSNANIVNSNLQVNLIVGHHNWISVAYSHFICCYKLKDGMGWQLMFQSSYIEEEIEKLALNSKHQLTNSSNLANLSSLSSNNSPLNNSNSNSTNSMKSNTSGSNLSSLNTPLNTNSISSPTQHASTNSSPTQFITASLSLNSTQNLDNSKLCTLIAISFKTFIRLWIVTDETNNHLIGNFNLNSIIDNLFFIGSQLVATSTIGRIGVWNSLSQLWQTQDVTPISSFDTAGSVLLLGGQNGVLYYIDMQKFPLRMKDNDLLVTQLYKDPLGEPITALSVYLTPKTTNTGNWIEIAYGTCTGHVRVIVQHPETVGHGPQLFQSFSVHRGSVIKVMLTEKHLVSVCSEFNHVRTWSVTRFRGMISTQPGSTPLASFKIVTIDAVDAPISYSAGNDIGPFGDRDNYQVFVQKVVPYTDQLFVRLSSTGKRICTIKSVDYSTITSFCVHECEEPSRLNSRPRRYLFTGHSNGTIQLWDLTTALELKPSDHTYLGGPTSCEFAKLLDRIELSSNSGYSTPTTNCISPCNLTNSKLHKNLLINSSNSANNIANTGDKSSNYHHNPSSYSTDDNLNDRKE